MLINNEAVKRSVAQYAPEEGSTASVACMMPLRNYLRDIYQGSERGGRGDGGEAECAKHLASVKE